MAIQDVANNPLGSYPVKVTRESFGAGTSLVQHVIVDSSPVPSLINVDFDYYAITYVVAGNGAGEAETITYKTGGAGGTTVALITYTYDASNRVSTAART